MTYFVDEHGVADCKVLRCERDRLGYLRGHTDALRRVRAFGVSKTPPRRRFAFKTRGPFLHFSGHLIEELGRRAKDFGYPLIDNS